jgi:hypothetical protein
MAKQKPITQYPGLKNQYSAEEDRKLYESLLNEEKEQNTTFEKTTESHSKELSGFQILIDSVFDVLNQGDAINIPDYQIDASWEPLAMLSKLLNNPESEDKLLDFRLPINKRKKIPFIN